MRARCRLRIAFADGGDRSDRPGGGGWPVVYCLLLAPKPSAVYWEAPAERGILFGLLVYKRVGI